MKIKWKGSDWFPYKSRRTRRTRSMDTRPRLTQQYLHLFFNPYQPNLWPPKCFIITWKSQPLEPLETLKTLLNQSLWRENNHGSKLAHLDLYFCPPNLVIKNWSYGGFGTVLGSQ